ncbi:type II secretion system protein GspF [Solemya velum gill symbiont]|uniref:type II secretion system inner membrane protein GspF n=1 Tax=Solemya velum gill symbiont TaxID=2340 RepID=UPI000997609F|nr:type II secretion system inner membrane protein GspF [Solemya velum gill symbiont]OOZ18171.1 type II secretion system protein GspF [Solemya velum gill symbiont]OOZ27721.1 type II secretion system protein GspF [Solemya velum gill symbiont]
MPAWSWEALDAQGRIRKGVQEADSPKHLRQLLRSDGLNPVSLQEVSGRDLKKSEKGGSASSLTKRSVDRRLGATDLSMFTRQLATLLRARLPVEEALRVLVKQADKSWQKSLYTSVRSRVVEGVSLADALRQHPQAFPEYYAATVAAGEQSGQLEGVLERLADYAEQANETRQKVMLSMLYPVVVSIVAVLIVVILMVFVVPRMISVFEHMDQDLPLLTRGLIWLSDFLQNYGIVVAVVIAVAIALYTWAYTKPAFKLKMHRLILKMPFLAHVSREMNTGRFLITYGILLASKVSATQGMLTAAEVLANLEIREHIKNAAARVREGASIGSALGNTGFFSAMALNLIASGEASGNLAEMLERAGENQERTLQASVTTIVGIMEPVMIVIMGGVVMMIVLAILLPILQMNQMV